MTIFEVAAKIVADTDGFDKAMDHAEASGKSLKNALTDTFSKIKKVAAGALSVAAIKKGVDAVMELANETAAAGDRIDKQSQALGLSRKAYQEWDYILGQNGASIDSLGASMKTLNKLVLDAHEGGEEAKDSFAKLGVGIHELENLSVEDQFEAVVRAFQRMPAGAQKSALAVQMFGRNGMTLLPLLNQADTSIDELRQRAEELGLIMSDDAVDAAVVYGDSLDDLQRTFNSFKYAIGAKILPTLTKGIQGITNYAGKLRRAYDSNGLKGVWNTLVADVKNIRWPTWDEVKTVLSTGWASIEKGLQDLVGSVSLMLGLPDFPHDAGAALKAKFDAWWSGIQQKIMDWAVVTVSNFVIGDENGVTTLQKIKTWWNEKIAPNLASTVDFSLGLLGLPDTYTIAINFTATVVGWYNTILKWLNGVQVARVSFISIVDSWLTNIKTWIGSKITNIAIGFTATLDDWYENIKGWIDGTKLTQITLNFLSSVGESDWIRTISSWLTKQPGVMLDFFGKATSNWVTTVKDWLDKGVEVTIGFGAKIVSDFINTVLDWIKNGVNVVVNFLSGAVDDKGAFQGGTPSGLGWGESFNVPATEGWGYAKGLNSVPYDGFRAVLHRGEQVLTASQARRNRNGGGGVDISALASAVVGAVREGMSGATVDSYLDGRSVTGGVSRRTMNQLKARRFAGT